MYLCKHIITQKINDNMDNKGTYCNDFIFNSNNNKYCINHNKRHNKKNTCIRSFKIRYYPTKHQKLVLKNIFGCCRKTYNLCVNDIEKNKTNKYLRNKYVCNVDDNLKYLKNTPKEVRAYSVKEFVVANNNNKNKLNYFTKKLNERKITKEMKKKYHKKLLKFKLKYRTIKTQQSMKRFCINKK